MRPRAFRLAIIIATLLAFSSASQAVPADELGGKPGDRTTPRAIVVEQQEPAVAPSEKKMSPRETKLMRGDIYMARKMYVEAVAVYQDLLREEPRNAELMNKIGIAYHQQSRMNDAKKYYKRAIKTDKNYASAYNNLGSVEYSRKKYKGAVKEFNKAIKLDPTVATYQHNLFHAYWGWKKYDDALVTFQRAVALDPQVFERRSAGFGPTLQNLPMEERASYYFFMAKAYAIIGNADRCAYYLARARDEGYVGMASVAKDPAFALVVESPAVQAVLQVLPVAGNPKQ